MTKTAKPIAEESEPAIIEERRTRPLKRDGKTRATSADIGMGDEDKSDVTDLVLVIHGIGQGVRISSMS